MKPILCPTCNQDLREPPHKGLLGRDCPQCGQGIMWRFASKVERANKRVQRIGLRRPRKLSGSAQPANR